MSGMDRYYKNMKEKQSSSTVSTASGGMDRFFTYQRWNSLDTSSVDEKYINSFMSDANTFFSSFKDGNTPHYASATTSLKDLETRNDTIQGWLYKNKNRLDEKSYNELSNYIESFNSGLGEVKNYYSQWETEDDYNNYLKGIEDYEAKKTYDVNAGKKELEELEKIQSSAKQIRLMLQDPYMPSDKGAALSSQLKEIESKYGDIDAVVAEKRAYIGQAERMQTGIELSSAINNADFKEYSKIANEYGKELTFTDKSTGRAYNGVAYMRNTPGAIADYEDSAKEQSGPAERVLLDQIEYKAAKHMTKDEFNIYNYYFAKDVENGTNDAQKFLESIEESLNMRVASEKYGSLEGETFSELIFGIEAGFDQFESGIKNLFSSADYIPQSAIQMTSGMVREDLADNGFNILGSSLGQVGYDMVTTTSNMLPSILVSMTPYVGQVAGATLLGASASGNAYAEMLNLGYTKGQARAYSALVGASEAGLQYLLGGITSLGGKASKGLTGLALSKVDNALGRAAIKWGGSMLSEGFEEGLQTVLEPWFKSLATGVDFEASNASEVIYSGLLGALSAGVLEGGSIVAGEVNTYNQGAKLKESGTENIDRLIKLGSTFSADTVAYQLAGRVNENTGAYTVGRLLNEVGASLSEKNLSDIEVALIAEGMTSDDAKTISKWLNKAVEGGYFNKEQVKALEENEIISKVFYDVIVGENSTVNQRISGYNELYALAQKQAKSKAQNVENKEVSAQTPTAMLSDEEIVRRIAEATGRDVSEVAQEFAQQSKINSVTENATTEESAENGALKSSNIKEIASIKDGEIMLRLNDGETVNSKDVEFSSDAEALIYENIVDMGLNAVTANAFVKGFEQSGLSAENYANGFREAYKYGKYNFPMQEMSKNGFSALLDEATKKTAYDLGKTDAKYDVSKMQEAVRNAKVSYKVDKDTMSIDEALETKGLTNRQKASLKGLKALSDTLGTKIRIFVSKVDENGKRIGENGRYDPATGIMYIDLYAGAKGEGTLLFTAAHELTHFIKQWSPEKFKIFADFLMEKYGEKGVSVDVLVKAQINKAKNSKTNPRDLSYDEAYEEVIADSCEAMLADGDAISKIAELKAKDKSLWQKIKSFITNLVAKIKKAYEGLKPDSVEGQYVKKMLDSAERLKTLWSEALVEAGETYSEVQKALGEGSTMEVNENGEFTVGQTADGTILYNDRTYDEGGRETLETTLKAEGFSEEDIKAALTILDAKHNLVKELSKEFSEQDKVNKATLTTDLKDGHAVLSALVSNGDYPVNIDLLMVCKKRLAYQRVINRLCETGLIKQATIDSLAIAEINKILGKYGFETACLGCFVESRRIRIQEWAETICKEWNGIVDKMVGKGNAKAFNFASESFVKDLSNKEVEALSDELESAYEREGLNYGRQAVVKKMEQLLREVPSLRKHLSVADLITPQGRTHIKSLSAELNSLIACRYGSNTPKIVQDFNPYNHELAKYGKVPSKYSSLREYLYAIGGARMQSFSDFIVENWFDYCQIVADLTARKLPMHTYTKEIVLAKLFGMTGIKINMSLIPDIDRSLGKEYAGLTKNAEGEYELIWADKDRFKATKGKSYMQSINFADAIALQEDPRYSSNVGTIAVGISDNHIRFMLDDARIRMIIPYHSSGMNPIFANLVGTDYYKDYTNNQNTSVEYLLDSKGKRKDVKLTKEQKGKLTSGFEFNETLQRLGDARATAQAYLEWCADASQHTITINGETYTAVLTPKFNDFSDHQNYYKLLEDFNTYDSISEQAAPQGDVQQIYPEDFEDILRDELTSRDNYRKKQEPKWETAMGEIEAYLKKHTKLDTINYAKEHGIKLSKKDMKLSDRDSQGNELSKEQQYSYEALTSKPNMKLTTINNVVQYKPTKSMRKSAVDTALENAKVIGKINSTGAVTVYVGDVGREVVLSKKSLEHGLDRRFSENLPATLKAGEILKNSIRINELTPKVKTASSSYVLIGAAKSSNGDLSIIEFVVNEFTNEVASMDVLKSINTKKEAAVLNAPPPTNNSLRITTSDISIAELLDFVNRYFPDVLPEPVWKHYGHTARPEGELGKSALYSDRDNIGYHAGDLGKAEYYSIQGSYRGTGHFGTGTYFVGDEERISGDNTYGKRPHHAVDFSDYNLYKIKNNEDGWKLHEQLRIIDGGVPQEWHDAASKGEYRLINSLEYYDIAEEKYGEDQYSNEAKEYSFLEMAKRHNIEVMSRDEFSKEHRIPTEDEDFLYYYVDYLKDTVKEAVDTINDRYMDYREAFFYLGLRFGERNVRQAIQKTIFYQNEIDPEGDRNPYNDKQKKADSLATVFMKALGYEGIDVRGTRLDNVEYGSVIYDLKEDTILYQDRDTDSVSNRSLLAGALESVAQNDIERNKLKEYKSKITLIESEQAKLTEVNAKIKELSFAKGPRDAEQIKKLQFEANQHANRINTYDRQLLNFESTKALKGVLEREKQKAYKKAEQRGKEALEAYREKATKTQRELLTRAQESRKKGIESRHKTEMRHKIKKVVNELNDLLLHGSKERNVKLGMQQAVASALDAINMDTVGADARIAKYNELIAKAKDPDVIASLTETRDRIQAQGDSLGDKLKALKDAYYDIQHGEEGKNYPTYFKEEASLIEQRIQSVIKEVGNTSLRDMSLKQLIEVYDMYKMVLTTIRNANSVWREGRAEDLQQNASAVMSELEKLKKLKGEGTRFGETLRSYSWNEMTPYYAFDRIGSKTLTSFFWETIKGQNTYAIDVDEAKAFADSTREKYGYKKWKLDEVHEFKLGDGRTFEVTLKHMLSIYAYSKREQALSHMSVGGFFFNDKSTFRKKGGIIELIKRDDEGYKIDADILAEIKGAMSNEQLKYVDEMQEYLTKMGEKGNEVTRVLWGIDIFKEKVYFPLKSKDDFIKRSTETAQSVSLKNDGMTKETVPGASNPIVLEAFDEVWSSHIDRMSQYHAFVIPIDNLNKLHQYGTWSGTASMSVSTMLTARFGSAVNEYISQFIKDLNGNVVSEGAKNPLMGFLSKFKKTAVGASSSTVVQQPTAILRAMALVDAKYFVGKPNFNGLSKKWTELKKYAPIAIIKDIGGFDAGSGVQVSNWLNSDALTGIDKVMNTIDDISMKGAELADQVGWTAIWEAVKREVKATTNLEGEALLKKAGERFTEVIVKTQVYDSTLSRSGFMRSKNDLMKMLTAFMGEPTLSINMMFNAVTNVLRGGSKAQAARTIGYTYASIIAASAMASLIYALRDDDDDESYLEKYMQALGGQFIDDVLLAPITSLPAIKDIVSIFQGWDVERTDVAIFKDIKDAFDGLDSNNKSTYRKIEDLAGAFASAFGVPLKNLLRTGREIYNAFDFATNGITGGDLGGAFVEGITGKEESKYEKFYDAVKTGKNLKAVIKEYTDNGVKTSTLASQITSYYKPLYIQMNNSERASLKGYLLNAYVLLGYNRAEKSKDIDKWLEQ